MSDGFSATLLKRVKDQLQSKELPVIRDPLTDEEIAQLERELEFSRTRRRPEFYIHREWLMRLLDEVKALRAEIGAVRGKSVDRARMDLLWVDEMLKEMRAYLRRL